jgi:uncharacterized protein
MNVIVPKEIVAFVERELEFDHSGHGLQHAERVFRNACAIMEEEGRGDFLIVAASAFLHDCIDHKLFEDLEKQREKIVRLLEDCSFSKAEIEEVLEIITSISFSNQKSRSLTSLNAQIVCDADRLDAIGAIGVVRAVSYGALKGREFYSTSSELNHVAVEDATEITSGSTLAHFKEKLLRLESLMFTSSAKRMAKRRTAFMKSFLEELSEEILDN